MSAEEKWDGRRRDVIEARRNFRLYMEDGYVGTPWNWKQDIHGAAPFRAEPEYWVTILMGEDEEYSFSKDAMEERVKLDRNEPRDKWGVTKLYDFLMTSDRILMARKGDKLMTVAVVRYYVEDCGYGLREV